MKVRRLAVSNFRNIAGSSIVFPDGVTVFCGANAQGKTAILEAVWLFAVGKSFRASRDREMIRFGEETARLDIEYEDGGREMKSSIQLFAESGKKITINGVGRRPGDLAGGLRTVLFTPDHLELVKSGPGERRSFMNIAICQLWPRYMAEINGYNRFLEQRNALLKNLSSGRGDINSIDVWDEGLAERGAAVTRYRRDYIRRLSKTAMEVHGEFARGESAEFIYHSFDREACETGAREKELSAILLKRLRERRKEDIRCGVTGAGPHRDDLEVLLNGRPAKNFASQGQQRSCVVSMKIAEAQIFAEESGEYPLLLLDDIMSELDPARQAYIISRFGDRQVLITCCEMAAAGSGGKNTIPAVMIYRVENGEYFSE